MCFDGALDDALGDTSGRAGAPKCFILCVPEDRFHVRETPGIRLRSIIMGIMQSLTPLYVPRDVESGTGAATTSTNVVSLTQVSSSLLCLLSDRK